ncbi:MAG: DUF4388 domain-containing protein [Gemmatimonadetes bacterium]|nr:DUF4388 domain-containing protein [Gemmatimonadota bacterium]
MSLRGNLVDFPMAEVLQLLAVQEKTGILRIYGEKQRLSLVFDRGVIVSTWDRTLTSVDPLKAHIFKKGVLPEHLTLKALKLETRAEYPFVEILLREEMLSPDQVTDLCRELIRSVLMDVLTWEKGRFDFAPEMEVERYGPDCFVKAESILLEAAQKLDEKRAARGFPGLGQTVTINKEIVLSAQTALLHGVGLLAIPFLAFLGSFLLTPDPVELEKPILGPRVAAFSAEREMRNLRMVLEMYQVVHNRYPMSLIALVDEGLLSVDQLSELRRVEVKYRPLERGTRYILFTPEYFPLAKKLDQESAPAEWHEPEALGAR